MIMDSKNKDGIKKRRSVILFEKLNNISGVSLDEKERTISKDSSIPVFDKVAYILMFYSFSLLLIFGLYNIQIPLLVSVIFFGFFINFFNLFCLLCYLWHNILYIYDNLYSFRYFKF